MPEDRTGEFLGGAYSTQFHTMQQHAGGYFRPTSVLQPFMSSGIGMSAQDQSRRLYGGGMLSSVNGQSPDTWQQRTWLETPYRQL
jgi:hypothetical protein